MWRHEGHHESPQAINDLVTHGYESHHDSPKHAPKSTKHAHTRFVPSEIAGNLHMKRREKKIE